MRLIYHIIASICLSFTIYFVLCSKNISDRLNNQLPKILKTEYEVTTQKDVPNLKIALISDLHLGRTLTPGDFSKYLETIQKENPDIIALVGDYVDDFTTKEQMIKATYALGQVKTKHGIYFVFGNHDKENLKLNSKGFTEKELIKELERNGIIILRDNIILLDNSFYIIGRRDFSDTKTEYGRLSMEKLVLSLDKSKYIIVLDHQPIDFNTQAQTQVDLVLCGHTHGIYPLNKDLLYGHEKRGKTDFIVTSGISDEFKNGRAKSEFVVVNVTSLSTD
ncbi:MAG: metallophosphoesterase [Alphaproteobacteria bacterium]|nr:metallophosphoesterase [Alphaproteobacteria bacterium]